MVEVSCVCACVHACVHVCVCVCVVTVVRKLKELMLTPEAHKRLKPPTKQYKHSRLASLVEQLDCHIRPRSCTYTQVVYVYSGCAHILRLCTYTQVVQVVHNIRSYYIRLCLNCNRPYAIDIITHMTKHETDGRRKFGYYVAILSGKKGHGLRSISTVEHFVSSFLTSAGNDFVFTPRMHKISTGPNTH